MRDLYARPRGTWHRLRKQDRGLQFADSSFDTLEANRALGFASDSRGYDAVAEIIRDLGIRRRGARGEWQSFTAALAHHCCFGGQVFELLERNFDKSRHKFHNRTYLILAKSLESFVKWRVFAPHGVKITVRLVPHIGTSNFVTFMLRPRAHASRAQPAVPRQH
ncbi:hypothetical protein [Rhizobium giardinii]|uniref:hypothetical protein n=1 Tax=Rhizobium giardinii TaxID=56731 RepID=UPI003B83A323